VLGGAARRLPMLTRTTDCLTVWDAFCHTSCMTNQVAVRLPKELISQLDALVPGTHPSRSDAVRRSIELYLYRLACEQDAERYEREPLADEELALGDDAGAWSDAPPW